MPSRTAVALILAFWLVTTGWMVRREFWPWFQTDRPPSLGVGLAEEAYTIPIPVRWVLYRNGEEIGRLITLTDYRPED
ncbi:MAG TPA: hypothetical protein VIL46_12895, partial [Gemmataceae bacterium]